MGIEGALTRLDDIEDRVRLLAENRYALETLAPSLGKLRRRWLARVRYDGMSDGLIWPDELPERQLSQEELALMRILLRYRTVRICGLEIIEWSTFWSDASRAAPSWPGFRPERCRPSNSLARHYRVKAADFTALVEAAFAGEPP